MVRSGWCRGAFRRRTWNGSSPPPRVRRGRDRVPDVLGRAGPAARRAHAGVRPEAHVSRRLAGAGNFLKLRRSLDEHLRRPVHGPRGPLRHRRGGRSPSQLGAGRFDGADDSFGGSASCRDVVSGTCAEFNGPRVSPDRTRAGAHMPRANPDGTRADGTRAGSPRPDTPIPTERAPGPPTWDELAPDPTRRAAIRIELAQDPTPGAPIRTELDQKTRKESRGSAPGRLRLRIRNRRERDRDAECARAQDRRNGRSRTEARARTEGRERPDEHDVAPGWREDMTVPVAIRELLAAQPWWRPPGHDGASASLPDAEGRSAGSKATAASGSRADAEGKSAGNKATAASGPPPGGALR
jgi:hypothetical protein